MQDKDKKRLSELEEEVKRLKKKAKRQKWINVFLLWSK
jgi:hypothetical protein